MDHNLIQIACDNSLYVAARNAKGCIDAYIPKGGAPPKAQDNGGLIDGRLQAHLDRLAHTAGSSY